MPRTRSPRLSLMRARSRRGTSAGQGPKDDLPDLESAAGVSRGQGPLAEHGYRFAASTFHQAPDHCEAAEVFNASPRTVRPLIERVLYEHRIGHLVRTSDEDIAAFLAANRIVSAMSTSVA